MQDLIDRFERVIEYSLGAGDHDVALRIEAARYVLYGSSKSGHRTPLGGQGEQHSGTVG